MRINIHLIHSIDREQLRSIEESIDQLFILGENIMSAVSDFAAKQAAFNASLNAAVTGLTTDVKTLNDMITSLQNSPGQITPEDQALLDQLVDQGQVLADKFAALDALTPPPPPDEPDPVV